MLANHTSVPGFSPLYVLRGHRAPVQAAASCPAHPTKLLSGDAEGVLCVWDLEQRRTVHAQQLHDSNAGILQVHALLQHQQVLTQGRDGNVQRWQLAPDGSMLLERALQTWSTGAFSFCRCAVLQQGAPPAGNPAAPGACSGSAAAARPDDLQVQLADSLLRDPPGAGDDAAAAAGPAAEPAAQDPDGPQPSCCHAWLAMAATDTGAVGLWQTSGAGASAAPDVLLEQQQQHGPTGPARGMVMAVQLCSHPRGQAGAPAALVGYESGAVACWDPRQPAQPVAEARLHEEPVMALALHPRGGRGLSGAADSHLALFEFDVAAGTMTYAVPLQLGAPGVADACVRWDGRVAATAGWDGKVRLWSLRRPALQAVGRYHTKQVGCVLYEPVQQLLVSGAQDCTLAVWPAVAQAAPPP